MTGVALDKAFQSSAQAAFQERLRGHIYALLAAGELKAGHLIMPDSLPEARFSIVGSGLYAQVRDQQQVLWRSISSVGIGIPTPWQAITPLGTFQYVTATDGGLLYQINFGVVYEDTQQQTYPYTFSVAENLDAYYEQVRVFRRSLGGWLMGSAIVLLVVQAVVLRWALRPLQQVAMDLSRLESGQQTQLLGQYPDELLGLTHNLNAVLKRERQHLQRYRNTLGDLAHSLKTPLTVLQGVLEGAALETAQSVALAQIGRMRQLIEYQLQRAMVSGRLTLNPPIDIAGLVESLVNSLKKVYWQKPITWTVQCDLTAGFYGQADDFMEILGNLADNACKWCHHQVSIQIQPILGDRRPGLWLEVADDGVGISEDQQAHLLQRGVRGDSTVSGHGIGLAIVQDIVDIYGGSMAIKRSFLGGAAFVVRLPAEHY